MQGPSVSPTSREDLQEFCLALEAERLQELCESLEASCAGLLLFGTILLCAPGPGGPCEGKPAGKQSDAFVREELAEACGLCSVLADCLCFRNSVKRAGPATRSWTGTNTLVAIAGFMQQTCLLQCTAQARFGLTCLGG